MNTGAMIAFFLPSLQASDLAQIAKLAMPDRAEPAESLHLTLVYFGEAADISTEQRLALKDTLSQTSARIAPLTGSINGIGRFVDSDPNPIIANVDAPGLAELRATLISDLRQSGIQPVLNHGYTPHITLAYLPESEVTPPIKLSALPCQIGAITLTLGDERTAYPLIGAAVLSEVAKTPDTVVESGVYTVSVGETEEDIKEKPEDVKEFRLTTPDFSFKGPIPDVPLAPGVDYDALIAIPCPACHGEGCPKCGETGSVPDPNPLFVVRPLAKRGAVSDNSLKYDQELLDEICEQVIRKKPAGRQGHVSEEASSYSFPDDVAIWVGAAQHGDTLFGKAFIYRNKPFHEMVIRRKAAGSTLSNSIWGKGHFLPNADGTQRLRGLALETIDFAPVERAALGESLDGQIVTTSEMKPAATVEAAKEVVEMTDKHDDKEQDLALIRNEIAKMAPHALHEIMNKEQRQHCAEMHVREMEPASVYEMLPQGHKQHCAECYAKEFAPKMPAAEMEQNTQQIAEMKQQLAETTAAMARSAQQIAEMQQTIAEYKQKDFDSALESAAMKPFGPWNVRGEDSKKAIASAKDNFKMYIVAQMATMDGGAKIENITPAAESAWPKYEPQAALLKVALSGGNVIAGVQGTVSEQRQTNSYGYDPKTGRYNEDAAKQARAAVMGG